MRMFAGAIRLDGGPAPMSFRAAVRGAPYCAGHALHWVTTDGLLAVVGPEHGACPPAIARSGSVTVVGVARIDNRGEILAWLGDIEPSISDLALAGRVALRRGVAGVARLLGDFAFVVWEADTRTLIAARDTFGVKQLYYATPSPGVVTFSSRAELLAQGDDYNLEYLAAWLSYCPVDTGTTVYSRVTAVPPATAVRFDHGLPRSARYWSAFEAQRQDDPIGSESAQCDAVRALLIEAVRLRVTDGPHTWSHLSGGLDSSSVVSTAEWLARSSRGRHALAGTVSFVDPVGTAANEREYSDSVASHYSVRNEKIPHQLDRRDVLINPPHFDQPAACSYGVATRDLQLAATVTRAGGTTLLTGMGGDNLFLGTMFFFADWIARGQVTRAIREMAHRAAVGRVSFWELAGKNALMPLLPSQIRRLFLTQEDCLVPPWMSSRLASQYGLHRRTGCELTYGGSRGARYAYGQAATVEAIPSVVSDGMAGECLDVRHPYLHRPLVEMALRLSPEMCVRPHARKWVLREAMRGILPEHVRMRIGKASGDGLSSWTLYHDQHLVGELLRDSVLAELGIIDVQRLRAEIAIADLGGAHDGSVSSTAQATLDVELWLQVRSGRWGPEVTGHRTTKEDSSAVRVPRLVNS
jgi:asparagine synthase (glutamine-hydrolysing)